MQLASLVLGIFWAILFNQVICTHLGGTLRFAWPEFGVKVGYALAVVTILAVFMLRILPRWY